MTRAQYRKIEEYMLRCMIDSAHDSQHIYRVLYMAMDIARHEGRTDRDILIAACLLHDIGRAEQAENPALCHAEVCASKAYAYLTALGWEEQRAAHVRDCIFTHRFRKNTPPASWEAKILFDADKLEASGLIGVARTLIYQGQEGMPLYTLQEDGNISDGSREASTSFFHEYRHKLSVIYDRFYTARARELAKERQAAAAAFYIQLLGEVRGCHEKGENFLSELLADC